jgi:integrase
MKSLTKPELVEFLRVARKHSELDYLMYKLMFYHGLRVTEVVGGWSVRKDKKTGERVRVMIAPISAENIVDRYLAIQRLKGSNKTVQSLPEEDRDLIEKFMQRGGPFFTICRKTVWLHMKKYSADAGIPAFKAHPHALKHTCGKLGLEGGMTLPELQTRLGHKSGSSTMVYLQTDDEQASKAFAAAVGA